MEKLFCNGKKVIKFFLRLLPVFMIIYSCINNTLFLKNVKINYNDTDINLDTIYNQAKQEELSYLHFGGYITQDPLYSYNALGFMDVCDKISYLITNNELSLEEVNPPLNIVIYILVYELYLSIAFIGFDVLNYMLTVAERFLNKEERLSEK